MALSVVISDFKGQASGVSATITSNTLTGAATGDWIDVCVSYADNADSTAWTVSNTGTAISWTKQQETNVGSEVKLVHWTGIAGATPPGTVSVQSTAGSITSGSKCMWSVVQRGQHATDPLPAGNLFAAVAGGNDRTQSITPTSAGSNLFMMLGDWGASNTFAEATNCDHAHAPYHEAGEQTVVSVKPETQPRPDTSAFTIAENDSSGSNVVMYIAWEVQAALEAGAPGILTEPQSKAVIFGDPATFTVEATSYIGASLSYQWTENGANVGSNASTYTTTQTFTVDQNARFAVSVWDTNGTTQSQDAYLRLTIGSGYYVQETVSSDKYTLEFGGGSYLIEPWSGAPQSTTYGPFFIGPLNGLGSSGRTHKSRLH